MFFVTNYERGNVYATNQHERIQAVGERQFKITEDRKYKLFYQPTNIEGVYYYGCIQLKDDYDHKAGYVWSSRASVINKAFNLDLIDCIVDYMGVFAISADTAAKKLSETYAEKKIDKIVSPKLCWERDEDVYYGLNIE